MASTRAWWQVAQRSPLPPLKAAPLASTTGFTARRARVPSSWGAWQVKQPGWEGYVTKALSSTLPVARKSMKPSFVWQR